MYSSPLDVTTGCWYDVPCVNVLGRGPTPVLCPAHEDGRVDCLNDAARHYHIDFRFTHKTGDVTAILDTNQSVFMHRMKAFRSSFDALSFIGRSVFFFVNRWHERNPNKMLSSDRRCPHKGLQVVNECGRCPGHSLEWNHSTRKLAFHLPFFLEMANDGNPKSANPRGIIENDLCVITIEHSFNHDGTVIMVDSNGCRYGEMKQIIPSRKYVPGSTVTFDADSICA